MGSEQALGLAYVSRSRSASSLPSASWEPTESLIWADLEAKTWGHYREHRDRKQAAQPVRPGLEDTHKYSLILTTTLTHIKEKNPNLKTYYLDSRLSSSLYQRFLTYCLLWITELFKQTLFLRQYSNTKLGVYNYKSPRELLPPSTKLRSRTLALDHSQASTRILYQAGHWRGLNKWCPEWMSNQMNTTMNECHRPRQERTQD